MLKKFKLDLRSIFSLVSSFLVLIGLIIYLVNSTTGYMAGQKIDPWIIVTSIFALILSALPIFVGDKIKWLNPVIAIVDGLLISLAICLFVLSRTQIAADIWFIPVNSPKAEADALYTSLVGVIFYILALISVAVYFFIPEKKEAIEA